MTFGRILSLAVLTALVAILGACRPGEHESLLERLRKSTDTVADPIPADQANNLYQGKRVASLFKGKAATDFEVATRHDQIRKFPCTDCHTANFKPYGKRQGAQKAHWGLEMHHAGSSTMDCFTCHAPDKGMSLRTLRGDSIGWDHPYLLCAQCHSRQATDWSIGSHGKRLGGWAGPRVVQSCTGCHNPHDPLFPVKMPVIEPMNSAPVREPVSEKHP
ncbi:MAG: hypothetical protein AAB214_19740 [Fibrobacterota bacterium]